VSGSAANKDGQPGATWHRVENIGGRGESCLAGPSTLAYLTSERNELQATAVAVRASCAKIGAERGDPPDGMYEDSRRVSKQPTAEQPPRCRLQGV
jgi:hypothetical protein